MTVRTAFEQGRRILQEAGIADPHRTAEMLLCHALQQERVFLFSHPEHELTTIEWIHYGRYLHQRLKRHPTQHILREQDFYGRPFHSGPEALIPRPETEHIVEEALRRAPSAQRVLDVGTGTGILAVTLALELKAPFIVATDISVDALRLAKRNGLRHGVAVRWLQCDLATAVRGPFDLMVSNPPYIPTSDLDGLEREVRDFEPRLALDGGPDGAEPYRRLVPQAASLLAEGGWLLVEIGFDIERPVRACFGDGWSDVGTVQDLAGHPRVVVARRTTRRA